MTKQHIAVIGGGLVGMAAARALLHARPDARITLYDKEARVGQHQSTHNSGVLHSGLYYTPGSYKAILARTGIRRMTEYCQQHGIAHEICGKLVVAVSDEEVVRLKALWERGVANGLIGLRWLSAAEAHEIEPHVRCVAAIHVPEEGIVDYQAVCDTLAAELAALGAAFRLGVRVHALAQRGSEWVLRTSNGEETADYVVNCAAQSADRLARSAGEDVPCRIVPFRGEYFGIRAERRHLVNHLIYPVPDPAFPFLGVHFTRLIGGGREAGPNAVLALSREGYRFFDVAPRDVRDTLAWPGFWRFLQKHPRMVAHELRQSLSRSLFVRSLQRLVPDIQESDLETGGAGVRAQPLFADGRLAGDFLFVSGRNSVHVLSAPSPAATASLVIGEEIAKRMGA